MQTVGTTVVHKHNTTQNGCDKLPSDTPDNHHAHDVVVYWMGHLDITLVTRLNNISNTKSVSYTHLTLPTNREV